MNFIIRDTAVTTGSISVPGIGCAVPTKVWAASRRLALAFLALPLAAASPGQPKADLLVNVEGLRNSQGAVMLCLTRRSGRDYLKCDTDPGKVSRVIDAGASAAIEIRNLEPGDYSLMLVHDENRNGRLDTTLGIPREGFAFSRNPGLRMGPPRYQDVHFAIPGGESRQRLKVKYLL